MKIQEFIAPDLVFNWGKRAGFSNDKLVRLLQFSLTASGLDANFSRRVTYRPDDPFRITFVGPLALPIIPEMDIHKKEATNPATAFPIAYMLSKGGFEFDYLPPLDIEELEQNYYIAQAHYALWLANRFKPNMEVTVNGD